MFNAIVHSISSANDAAEICGLLGGHYKGVDEVVATTIYSLTNLSLRKCSFAVDVEEFCYKREAIQKAGLVPLCIYHSHPNGLTKPSVRDRELVKITEFPLLIISQVEDKLCFECYVNTDGKITSIPVIIHCDMQYA